MTRKTKDLYVAVMRMISQLAPDFQLTQVIADFEEAATSTVLEVFGADVVIPGCWFHYAQALVKGRHMRKLGLTDACKSDVETSTAIIFRCLLCLPLLPVGDVQPACAEVSALLTNDSPSKPAMSQLLRYVSRQWLQKSSTGPAGLSV